MGFHFSEGKELKALIISDLYYHLQGELEGRKIGPGPFKELSQFLIESEFLQMYEGKYNGDLFVTAEDLYLFDLERMQADLGLDMWDYSDWKASKSIADTMLCCLQDTNSMISITSSKLRVLKALITVYAVYKDDVSSLNSEYFSLPSECCATESAHFDVYSDFNMSNDLQLFHLWLLEVRIKC